MAEAKSKSSTLQDAVREETAAREAAEKHGAHGGEGSTAPLATISQRALATVAVGGVEYEIEKQVTRPVLSQADGTPIYVLFDGPIHRAEERRGRETKDSDAPPPMIADITNLETGQLMTLVCGAVLVGELEEKYPEAGYIGKAFRLESTLIPIKGQSGKKMRIYNIQQLRRK